MYAELKVTFTDGRIRSFKTNQAITDSGLNELIRRLCGYINNFGQADRVDIIIYGRKI